MSSCFWMDMKFTQKLIELARKILFFRFVFHHTPVGRSVPLMATLMCIIRIKHKNESATRHFKGNASG
jgi:hypothetical protein